MRRYYIVSGILLTLSIIDFALAAPVLVQETGETGVDVVHLPKDAITVLEKRGGEWLDNMLEQYMKTWEKPIESSDSHASSSPAPSESEPPGPDHGSPNVVHSPEPDPASSTSLPDLMLGPLSPTATQAKNPDLDSFQDRFIKLWNSRYSDKGSDTSNELMLTPESSKYDSADDEPEWATAKVNPLSTTTGSDPDSDWHFWSTDPSPPKPSSLKSISLDEPLTPSLRPGSAKQIDRNRWGVPGSELTSGPDPNFDRDDWLSLDNPLSPSLRPSTPEPIDRNRWGISGSELTSKPLDPSPNWKASAQQPSPNPMSSTELDKDHDVNPPLSHPSTADSGSYKSPGSVTHPPSQDAGLPVVPEYDAVTPPSTGAELLTEPEHKEVGPPSPNLGSPKEPEDEVVPGPPPSLDPGYNSDHQSSSADSQPVDLQAAINNVLKSKGKQPAERSLDG